MPEETPREIARRLYPTLDQERSDAIGAEIQRPWLERAENNAFIKKWDLEILTPWSAEKNQRFSAFEEACFADGNTFKAIASAIENICQLGHRAADADKTAYLAVDESGGKLDLTVGDRLRAEQRKLADHELPRLKKLRVEQQQEANRATREWNNWIKSHPMPTPPFFQIRPAHVSYSDF